MCAIFEFCRNKFLMGVYEGEQSRGISGNSIVNEWMNDDDEWMMRKKGSSILLKIGSVVVQDK